MLLVRSSENIPLSDPSTDCCEEIGYSRSLVVLAWFRNIPDLARVNVATFTCEDEVGPVVKFDLAALPKNLT